MWRKYTSEFHLFATFRPLALLVVSPRVIAQPQITPDHMLQQPSACILSRRRAFDKLRNHGVEHGGDGKEAFVGLADVGKTRVVEEDFLDNEDRDLFRVRVRVRAVARLRRG